MYFVSFGSTFLQFPVYNLIGNLPAINFYFLQEKRIMNKKNVAWFHFVLFYMSWMDVSKKSKAQKEVAELVSACG